MQPYFPDDIPDDEPEDDDSEYGDPVGCQTDEEKAIAESEEFHRDNFDGCNDARNDEDFCPNCGFELTARNTCAVCDEDEDGDY